jgi:hypothetical protein
MKSEYEFIPPVRAGSPASPLLARQIGSRKNKKI